MTEKDQELYQNFPLVISERWQSEVAETVFDTINQEADKVESKKKTKHRKFDLDEKGNNILLYKLLPQVFPPSYRGILVVRVPKGFLYSTTGTTLIGSRSLYRPPLSVLILRNMYDGMVLIVLGG